ncbi:MAG: efflux RND transporter permease subunit, partial [Wenzhouxiangellaceae bacterium]
VRDWVEQRLLPQLQSIEGVATIEAAGGMIREVEVILDQQRLRSYSLTLRDVADQLTAENINIAAGNVTSENFDVMARTDARFTSAEEIRAVQLAIPDSNRRIRLEEVAEVRDGFREQRVFVRLDGVPAVQLSAYKLPAANTVQVADQLDATMARLRQSGFIPPDIEWRKTTDRSQFVRDSIEAVAAAAIIGALLAMVVVFGFLGSLRKSFVIGLSIPLAIMATFVLLGLGGLTLNVISLGGLALGVGLLLDNAIVMLENISRHRNRLGKEPDAAAHEGADEVISAITAGTLTNLVAVAPFLLITGLAALTFRELILTISFAVVASLAVALTLVPMLAAQMARLKWRSGFDKSRFYRAFDRMLQALENGYGSVLGRLIRWRWLVVATAAGLFAGSIAIFNTLGNEFLPQVDDGEVSIQSWLPAGATPEETNRISREVERVVADMPHVKNVFAITGGHFRGGTVQERPGRISLDISLGDPRNRPEWPAWRWVIEAEQRLSELDLPGARFRIRPPRIPGLNFGSSGDDVDLMIVGDDLDTLESLAGQLLARIAPIPGLDDLEIARDERSPLLSVHVDRERAAALGLNVGEIARTLRDVVTGAIPTRFQTGNA